MTRPRATSAILSLSVAALLARAAPCRADGAFPDSLQIFLPPDRPHEIVAATNFGLVISDDDGATFRLACEQAVSHFVTTIFMYQQGAAPDDVLYGIGNRGLFPSTDSGCTFSSAGGALAGGYFYDAFPDPSDPRRVLVLGATAGDGGSAPGLYVSTDAARSFRAPIFVAPTGDTLTGVEQSRSAAATLYLTMIGAGMSTTPFLVRSTDGGATFRTLDETAQLGAVTPRLAAVDADDPQTLYLRLSSNPGDALAISHDGGDTFHVPLQLSARMTAFLRRGDGTLLVGASDGSGYRSTDHGVTFDNWPGVPHLRALGERQSRLYALADDAGDGYAIGYSDDEGAHWQPLLKFQAICGPLACPSIQTACSAPFDALTLQVGHSPPDACGPESSGSPVDAAVGTTPARPGCGCHLGRRNEDAQRRSGACLALVIAVIAVGRRARHRRAPRSRG